MQRLRGRGGKMSARDEKLLAIAQIVGYDILPTLGEQNEVE